MKTAAEIAETLAAVYELGRETALSHDIDGIAKAALDTIQKALHFDNCAVALVDEATRELYTQAQRGYENRISGMRRPLDDERGITTAATKSGRVLYVPDVTLDPRYIPGVPGGRSELVVPLAVGGRVIGVIDVESKEVDAFTEADQELLSCVASQAAVAMENARRFERIEKDVELLRMLHDVAVAVGSSRDPREIMRRVYDKLHDLMGISTFLVALLDEELGEIRCEYPVEDGMVRASFTRSAGEDLGLTGRILQTRTPLLIRSMDEQRTDLPPTPFVIGSSCRSWLGVPLVATDRLIGVLSIQSDLPNEFDEHDQRVLSVVADQVATTFETARLLTENIKKAEQLSLVLDVSGELAATLSAEEIVRGLCRKLTTSLPTTSSTVTLHDEAAGELFVSDSFALRPLTKGPISGERIPVAANPDVARCVRDRAAVLLETSEHTASLRALADWLGWEGPLHSLLLTPLATSSKVLGLLWLAEARDRRRSRFSRDKIGVCRGIADRGAAALENALLHESLRENHAHLLREVEEHYQSSGVIGTSAGMRKVFALLDEVAKSSVTILIQGETGTGKDLIAKTVHFSGPRREKRFVPVDCGAIPETLVESELFGYRRGAFTGAGEDRKGLFEEADGGTLFLDEICNMTLSMQAKLLRALQEGEIRRVGDSHSRRVDVRIISATSRDLDAEVQRGAFREDLLYRLNVITVELPPLRERPEDIPLLAHHFMKLYSEREGKRIEGFSPKAMDLLMGHDYRRNNVRELENIIEAAVVLERSKVIRPGSLRFGRTCISAHATVPDLASLCETEKALIENVLRHTRWRKSRACAILGVSRPTLDRKLRKYHLESSR